jgi:hypothetical protein
MIKDMTEMLVGMRPKSQTQHGQEGDLWQIAAQRALANPYFIKNQPELNKRLKTLLSYTTFLTSSGRFLMTQVLHDGNNESYVMPTISDEVFDRLQNDTAVSAGERTVSDAAGFLSVNFAAKIGVIALRPTAHYSQIDQRVIIAHELTHSDEVLNNRPLYKLPISQTPLSPLASRRFITTDSELRAYRTSSTVLNGETNGVFEDYSAELYENAKDALSTTPRGQVEYPSIANYPALVGLGSTRFAAFSSVLEQLYDEERISPSTLVGTMAAGGLIPVERTF